MWRAIALVLGGWLAASVAVSLIVAQFLRGDEYAETP